MIGGMAATRIHEPRLRMRWPELDRLTWAIVISLLIHGALYGAYQGNKKYHWLEKIHLPSWLQKAPDKLTSLQPKRNPPQNQVEPTLVFVEVDPALSTVEPPKDSKYYSSKNSKAANPDPDLESNTPKITGTQEQIVKTDDVARSKAVPLQPAVPRSKQEQQDEQKQSQTPGDLALAKPDSVQHKDDGQAAKSRPRTLVEAVARQQQANPLAGQKMKQDGGVKRKLEISTLDAKATPFGIYDAMIVAAVQNRWYQLLDDRNFAGERSGKVSLEFRLHSNGRISDMRVNENTVDELLGYLCQRAVLDPMPFEKWPTEMKRLIGADYREIKFTFFYN